MQIDTARTGTATACTLEHYVPSFKVPRFLRYPGGKGRLIPFLSQFLPVRDSLSGRYIDPFVGGAAIFLFLHPRAALLSDINPELIDLYLALRDYPSDTWNEYCRLPETKEGYYAVRELDPSHLAPPTRAARTLYLNRTCFKGMWRHNRNGKFNIGYGGESRRWVINERLLKEVAQALHSTEILCSDFEPIVDSALPGDFVFLDPPYRPGAKVMHNAHYVGQEFSYLDQIRLAEALKRATRRNVQWVMTNSAHDDILQLYTDYDIVQIPRGTGQRPGIMSNNSQEVVISFQPLRVYAGWSATPVTTV